MSTKKNKSKKKKGADKVVVKPIVKKSKASPKSPKLQFTSKKENWIVLGVFLILSMILYFQCIPYGFVLDDKIVYTDNAYTKKGFSGISDLLSKETFQGYFGEQKDLVEGGRYRPLSLVTFAVEHQFFGLNAKVAHINNIILYGLCSWIIFLTLMQLLGKGKSKWWWSLPLIASTIYLLHPVHTEAVANIKGRDEIMAMIFAMLTLLFSIKYIDKGKVLSLISMSVFFFLGLLSKENVITFLAVIPLAILLFRSGNIKKLSIVTGLLFLLSVTYLVVRYQVIGYLFNSVEIKDVMNNPFYGMKGSEKYATIGYTLFEYIRLCVFPHPLTHDYYPYHIPKVDFSHWKAILAIVIHLGLLIVAALSFKKNKMISFGILFYLTTLTIVSNIVVGVGTFMNERFIFMASLGVCLLLGVGIQKLLGSKKLGLVGKIAMAALLILFGLKTFLRVPAWESALSLNKEAVKVSKNSARANSFMGTALFNEYKVTTGREDRIRLLNEAEVYIDQSLKILPEYTNGNLMKIGVLSERYKLDNDLDGFLSQLLPIASLKPSIGFITEFCEYLNSTNNASKMLAFYYDLGFNELYKKRKQNKWAVHFLKIGHKFNGADPNINKALYHIYAELGDLQKANLYAK